MTTGVTGWEPAGVVELERLSDPINCTLQRSGKLYSLVNKAEGVEVAANCSYEQIGYLTCQFMFVLFKKHQRAKPQKIVVQKWNHSVLDTLHPYELIGA